MGLFRSRDGLPTNRIFTLMVTMLDSNASSRNFKVSPPRGTIEPERVTGQTLVRPVTPLRLGLRTVLFPYLNLMAATSILMFARSSVLLMPSSITGTSSIRLGSSSAWPVRRLGMTIMVRSLTGLPCESTTAA